MALATDFRDYEGWGFPGNSKKAHYFREGEIKSLCNKWIFTGERESGNDSSVDNCAECKRKLIISREKSGFCGGCGENPEDCKCGEKK